MAARPGSAFAPELQNGIARIPAALAGSVSGIGSLPFRSADEAVQVIGAECPDLPFWPQLPRLSEREGAIGQGLNILADLIEPRSDGYGYQVKDGRIDSVVRALHSSSGQLTSANATGFAAFEGAMKSGDLSSALAVKGQIEGPLTLATHLFYRGRAFLADSSLFAAVAFHVSQMACWQIERLKLYGRPVLMFIDEPALCLDAAVSNGISLDHRLNALAAIFEDVRARDASAGLHCCAARPFARMCGAKPDILSFDAYQQLEEFFADSDALEFLHNGGWIAYGMVPNSPTLQQLEAASLFGRWLMAASMAGDPQQIAQRAIITATCGLGLLDARLVRQSFSLARAVGTLVRRLAGVDSLLFCESAHG